jgi:two-component system invasion response regulator UvrY
MLPNTDTHALMHQLLSHQPNCKVLVYTNSPEASYARKYLSLGACGYVNKLASSSELIIAIQVVLAGQLYVSEILMRQALGAKTNVQLKENPFDRLTHRESELLTHILKGYKNHEICDILNIEPSTVATIKVRLMRKLGVHNMVDLLTLAQQHRLV